jgi:tetratricopeptide (TPR) repeat protein
MKSTLKRPYRAAEHASVVDPIAPAGAGSVRCRAARAVAAASVVALALAVATKAGGTCSPDAGAAAGTASDCAPSVPDAPAAASPAEEGQRQLALARKALDEGERATDDAARRTAYETAKGHADRAVELMPESADARFVQFGADGRIAQLGGIAVAALQLVKLNGQLDEVLRLDPNHANALAARGGMLMKLPRLFGGNTKKGVEYLERAVALDSTAVGKRLELAEAYHIVGREQEAKATAQSALETARKLDQPERVATCERFIVELDKTCDGCAVKSIGR